MLILTRKSGEGIAIGNDILITVLSVQGKQVKLGVSAPERVTVYREEIFRRIQEENAKTSSEQGEGVAEAARQLRAPEKEKSGDRSGADKKKKKK